MVYLIGISNHNIQHDGDGCADPLVRNNFSLFLKEKIRGCNVNLVAEEFNEDALCKRSNGNVATVKNVVEERKSEGIEVEHRFCELSENERKLRNILSPSEIYSKKLNIHFYRGLSPILNENQQIIFDKEMRKSFEARETAWYEKIGDYLGKNIIFVCGADHIVSFESLLIGKGCKTKILEKSFGSHNSPL